MVKCPYTRQNLNRLFRSRNVNDDGNDIPGPKRWPLIGNILDVDLPRLHLSVSRMVETYASVTNGLNCA